MSSKPYGENANFVSDLMPCDLLDDAIEWIVGKYNPEDVFPKDELEAWAVQHGFTKPDDEE